MATLRVLRSYNESPQTTRIIAQNPKISSPLSNDEFTASNRPSPANGTAVQSFPPNNNRVVDSNSVGPPKVEATSSLDRSLVSETCAGNAILELLKGTNSSIIYSR